MAGKAEPFRYVLRQSRNDNALTFLTLLPPVVLTSLNSLSFGLIEIVLAELAVKRRAGDAKSFGGATEVTFSSRVNPFYVKSL